MLLSQLAAKRGQLLSSDELDNAVSVAQDKWAKRRRIVKGDSQLPSWMAEARAEDLIRSEGDPGEEPEEPGTSKWKFAPPDAYDEDFM